MTKQLSNYETRFHNKKFPDNLRKSNINIAVEYFKEEEKRFQDQFGNTNEAKHRYYQTLLSKHSRVLNILYWFNDYDLRNLTLEDIRKLYDNILNKPEVKSYFGKILNQHTLAKDYFSKELRGERGFFSYIGKEDLAKKVIKRISIKKTDIRWFEINDFKKMVNLLNRKEYELLFWLMFDTGSEISAILEFKKNNFYKRDNIWWINIPLEISKKGREIRNFFLYFEETQNLLTNHLVNLNDEDKLFKFGYANVHKILDRVSTGVYTQPKRNSIRIKDFRNSMNVFFLNLPDWRSEEVNIRSGRKPFSLVINDYINVLGIKQDRLIKTRQQEIESNTNEELKRLKEELRKATSDLSVYKEKVERINQIVDLGNKIWEKVGMEERINQFGIFEEIVSKSGTYYIDRGDRRSIITVETKTDKRIKDQKHNSFKKSKKLY